MINQNNSNNKINDINDAKSRNKPTPIEHEMSVGQSEREQIEKLLKTVVDDVVAKLTPEIPPGRISYQLDEIKVYCSDNPSTPGLPAYIGVGKVPLTPQQMLENVICGYSRRAEIIPSWDGTEILDEWKNEKTNRSYAIFVDRTKPLLGGIISAREFLVARISWMNEETRVGWYVNYSIDLPQFPAGFSKPGVTRGKFFGSGSCVIPIQGESESSLVRSMIHLSAGGSLPNWAVAKGIGGELIDFFVNVNKVFGVKK
jgi:hypothetical protein